MMKKTSPPALNADLRFAASTAQLGIPAAQRGIAYPPEGLKKLVDIVGPSRTKDIMFSARRVKAEEALQIGLVNRVVAPGDLEAVTIEYAHIVAGNAPLSVAASRARRARRSAHQGDDRRRRQRRLQGGHQSVHRKAQAGIPRPLNSGTERMRAERRFTLFPVPLWSPKYPPGMYRSSFYACVREG